MLAQDADDGRIALGLGDLQRGMGFWRCPPSVNSHVVLPFELDGLRAGTCSAKQLHGASGVRIDVPKDVDLVPVLFRRILE
jgi:hypothetical protein